GILSATEGVVLVRQLRRIGVPREWGFRVCSADLSLNDGCDVPLFEPRGLVDVLRIYRRTDVGLCQGNVAVATRIRRPVIDPVIRVPGRVAQIRVFADALVRADRVGRFRHAVALDQIEIQGRTRDGRSRGDT